MEAEQLIPTLAPRAEGGRLLPVLSGTLRQSPLPVNIHPVTDPASTARRYSIIRVWCQESRRVKKAYGGAGGGRASKTITFSQHLQT